MGVGVTLPITDLQQAYPRGARLLKRLFRTFGPTETYQWFESHGVSLITQEDDCVFPVSQNAYSVVSCLLNDAKNLGIEIRTKAYVTQLERQSDGRIGIVLKDKNLIVADRVAVTTGGSPRRDGFAYLERIGHHIHEPVPSLFTFCINNPDLTELMGTVVPRALTTLPGTKFNSEGPLLITHWGLSGPAILKLSSAAARFLHESGYRCQLSINWIGDRNVEKIAETIAKVFSLNTQKQMGSLRMYELPNRLWIFLLTKTGIPAEKKCGELGRKMLNKLVETLCNDHYTINGKGTFKEEFVTCGGISLDSILPNTLESKVFPGLFFAGEVLDIDGITGGFNLQAAWTTGYVVGQHLVEPFL